MVWMKWDMILKIMGQKVGSRQLMGGGLSKNELFSGKW